MGKGAFIKSMDRTVSVKKVLLSKGWVIAVRNYSTNTIMEKNRGKGVGLRIMNFQGQSKKIFLE